MGRKAKAAPADPTPAPEAPAAKPDQPAKNSAFTKVKASAKHEEEKKEIVDPPAK
jgi:hypothetical protein